MKACPFALKPGHPLLVAKKANVPKAPVVEAPIPVPPPKGKGKPKSPAPVKPMDPPKPKGRPFGSFGQIKAPPVAPSKPRGRPSIPKAPLV